MAEKLLGIIQCVQINDIKSEFRKITCGVPQGPVIGPKLFIMYINDICNVSKLLNCVIFADDTNLICSGRNLMELLCAVERELEILKFWFDVNKLSLNTKKTKLMVFGNKRVIDVDIKLKICDEEIERVFATKFLGVMIDDKITWKQHIEYIKGKISKTTAILFKSKDVLSCKALYIVCLTVWSCGARLLKQL